ncbi:MAG: hypothetical protein AB1297_08310 [bacterium]
MINVIIRAYSDKIAMFLTLSILILIGIVIRKSSLKTQKLIAFPLIVSATTFLSTLLAFNIAIIGHFGKVIDICLPILPIIVKTCVISSPFWGLILGLLISNKSLEFKLQITPLNIFWLLSAVFIGYIAGLALLIASIFINKNFDSIIMTNLFPLGHILSVLTPVIGGSLGAMLWSKKLKEQVKDTTTKGGQI